MQKSEALAKAVAELRRNVERAEQCSTEFADLMQNCINYLSEYRTWWLQQLHTEKEELRSAIETAVQEVTTCLNQGVEPGSALAQAMWTGPIEGLEVFRYAVSAPDLKSLCESWASYQNNLKSISTRSLHRPLPKPQSSLSPPSSDLFASIAFSKLQLYNLHSHQTTKHPLPVNWTGGESYLPLNEQTLMCLGGDPASTNVYELSLCFLQIAPFPGLSVPRRNAGVVSSRNWVYVFGGDPPVYRDCEKLGLGKRQWVRIGGMKYGRSCFTPCAFQALIYLPCPYTTPIIETFNPETESFSCLPIQLPPQMTLHCASVAFIANSELCILTNGQQMALWKVEIEGEFRLFGTNRGCCSSQVPLVVGSVVFIACFGRVERFSLENYAFIQDYIRAY